MIVKVSVNIKEHKEHYYILLYLPPVGTDCGLGGGVPEGPITPAAGPPGTAAAPGGLGKPGMAIAGPAVGPEATEAPEPLTAAAC